jgi:predicted exporter
LRYNRACRAHRHATPVHSAEPRECIEKYVTREACYVAILKWLTLALFAYVTTLAVVKVPWPAALRGLLVPSVQSTAATKRTQRLHGVWD